MPMVGDERPTQAADPGAGSGHQKLAASTAERSGIATAAAAGEPASASAAVKTLGSSPDLIEFDLAVAVIYHRSREAWFSGLHRGVMFFTIALGAGTVANLAPVITGVATALLAALDLALDLTGQAAKHAEFRQAHLALVQKLVDAGFSAEACAKAQKKMLKLGQREPPPYLIVEIMARNAAVLSLGRPESNLEQVTTWRRCTRHVWRWDGG